MSLRIFIAAFGTALLAMVLSLVKPFWLAAAALLAGCFVLALLLSRQFSRSWGRLDLDRPEPPSGFRELTPLLNRLGEQNRTIQRQTDELGRRQREFSAITENMAEGFLLLDSQGAMLSGNHSAMELIVPQPWDGERNLEKCGCRPELLEAAQSALAGQRSERLLSTQSSRYQVIASPVTAEGRVTGAVVILLDVTEREERETLRREFSANVSHELKTPLTSISGFAELLKDGLVAPDKVPEFSQDIYDESRRMISLVDDILRLSSLDEEGSHFETEDVDLYRLAADALEQLAPAARRQNVTLTLNGGPAVMTGVWAILSEVVYNLCDNAVKYNRPGGAVTVTVGKAAGQLRLRVADTGIGIPTAHQGRVFERFYRVDKSHSKAIGGTGLGLSIVKHGVAYHGGHIELESEPGQGTVVTVWF